MSNKDKEMFEKIMVDYLDLCESYKDDLPAHEFGYYLIKVVTKMIFDCAPNRHMAQGIILMATEDGIDWHLLEKESV